MIEVVGVTKEYGPFTAVSDLSFSVDAGEILGFLGPNGAGKTTTMRVLTGFFAPSAGSARVAGHDIVAEPVAAKRQLAYVPDEPKLFDTLTVWEHLVFIASAYSVDDFEAKARQLLETFELAEKRDTIGQELSRGMRQKVAICCAYLHDPRAILFDEPLTGLDPHAIRLLKASIVARAAEGAAVVVSSHLLSLVENLCTDLLILQKGRSLFCGPMSGARERFGALGQDVSLEEVFFRAIEGPAS